MTWFHVKVLVGALLGLLLAIAAVALVARLREAAPPPAAPGPTAAPEPATPAPAPRPSRSKGQSDWVFFFRVGDTLSRMAGGVPLGVVVRLERARSFPDGSTGPAYVVRSDDQRETVFDADELERSARIEAMREVGRLPIGKSPR